MDLHEFDPRKHYQDVVSAIENAGDGTVRIFRVELGTTRVEYWVVSVDRKGKRVVGLKALAVES